ncbi:MAG: OB-fold nucleic acid binding domain-containing protein [Candidatus Nanoarchaeia archaeon]
MVTKLKAKKRLPSQKIWIKDVLTSNYFKGQGWDPSYIEFNNAKISRVQFIATVVAKFLSEDGNYASITLDDGTETIRCKAFGPDVLKIRNLHIGSLVRFIGKIKEYNSERYVSPEIARELDDPNWLILHKLELGIPATGEPAPEEVKPQIDEQVAVEIIKEEDFSVQKQVLGIIKELDTGQGSDMAEVIARSKIEEDEARNIIIGLLKSGEIYEPRKGRLKVLD